jgi:hypothetical protein
MHKNTMKKGFSGIKVSIGVRVILTVKSDKNSAIAGKVTHRFGTLTDHCLGRKYL